MNVIDEWFALTPGGLPKDVIGADVKPVTMQNICFAHQFLGSGLQLRREVKEVWSEPAKFEGVLRWSLRSVSERCAKPGLQSGAQHLAMQVYCAGAQTASLERLQRLGEMQVAHWEVDYSCRQSSQLRAASTARKAF